MTTHSSSRQGFHKTEVAGDNGAVTAMNPLAAAAGLRLLEQGGNAIDAAVGCALAIGVVEPFMSGLGGASYAVVFDAGRGRVRVFDGSVSVPERASESMFELLPKGNASSGLYGWRSTLGGLSETGFLSVAIPGSVAVLELMHRECGVLPPAEVFRPAIELARDGFPVDWNFFIHTAASLDRTGEFEATRATFYQKNGLPFCPNYANDPNDAVRIKLPELADSLERLAKGGSDLFYRGAMALEIVEYMQESGGILNENDLASYRARELSPLESTYRGERLFHLPTHSGGPTVVELMNLVEAMGLSAMTVDSVNRVHHLAEAMRLAYTDRFRWMGDPDTDPVPYEGLVSKAYARDRLATFDPGGRRATRLSQGDPFRFDRGIRGTAEGHGDASDQHTTHLNVIDRDRNVVCLTQTLGARFGSGVTVPGLGFPLTNGMMWFDPEPGHLASIAPGKRALHAAAPTIWMANDGPRYAVGAPGARKIKGAVAQVLFNLIDYRMRIQDAIEAPRIHCDTGPLLCDERLFDTVGTTLAGKGHRVFAKGEDCLSSYFGRPSGVGVDSSGRLVGGIEPFKTGTALAY